MTRSRWTLMALTLLALLALAGAALADEPVDGRAGRAEIRFLEGMIDHHQMALDMANHCIARASTDEVRALCEAVIAAQTPEIEQMQGWLRDWYGIDYQPMSMLGISSEHSAPATDHSQHQSGAAPATDHSQHQSGAAPATDHSQHQSGSESGAMCGMMGGEGCSMMGEGGMQGMMGGMSGMMQGGGMSMMGEDMMPMMHMQMMMMQMQMMQMMMMHMGMGGMSGMGMMGGSGDPAMQQSAAEALAQTQPDHSAHHPAPEATPEAMDHSQHQMAPEATPEAVDHSAHEAGALVSDPGMTMGMMAGFDRLTGLDYDLAWLEAMIEHHDGALHMAERVLMWAQHPELQALAEAIIAAQTAEIEQMEALISQLGG